LKALFNIVIIYAFTLAGTMTLLMASAGLSQDLKATILEVRKGTATLKGARDARVRPAKPGGIVYFGDLIRPSRGATVVIRCGERRREVRAISGLADICPDIVGLRGRMRSGGSR
jgi:hypothetical protein